MDEPEQDPEILIDSVMFLFRNHDKIIQIKPYFKREHPDFRMSRSDFNIDFDNMNDADTILMLQNLNKIAIKLKSFLEEMKLSEDRIRERTKIINTGDVFLEHYMRRMMHPSRLAALTTDAALDVDEFMTRYVESL